MEHSSFEAILNAYGRLSAEAEMRAGKHVLGMDENLILRMTTSLSLTEEIRQEIDRVPHDQFSNLLRQNRILIQCLMWRCMERADLPEGFVQRDVDQPHRISTRVVFPESDRTKWLARHIRRGARIAVSQALEMGQIVPDDRQRMEDHVQNLVHLKKARELWQAGDAEQFHLTHGAISKGDKFEDIARRLEWTEEDQKHAAEEGVTYEDAVVGMAKYARSNGLKILRLALQAHVVNLLVHNLQEEDDERGGW